MLHVRSYWAGEDLDFFWEFNDAGFVQRHVEIERGTSRVRGAASLAEWNAAREARLPTVQRYSDHFGGIAEGPVHDWDPGWPREDLSPEEYEDVWIHARSSLPPWPEQP